MPGLEFGVLAVAAFGWAALAFLGDVLGPPPRPPGERSPFSGVDFGIE
jgi:hypothetical protein